MQSLPMAPRVTILMPVFNRERFVNEAIESVVRQDFPDFELLVVDDGSTDQTPDILEAWGKRESRIVVIRSERNQGIPAALNLGLAHARAGYVARLDSDDLMMPGRLAAQAAILDSDPQVVLVSCAYDTIDAEGRYIGTWLGDEPHEVVTYLLGFYNIVGGGGQVMFRLAEVLAEGGYNCEYPSSEDYDLWVRLLQRGRILTLPLVGMKKREHDNDSMAQYASVKRANSNSIMRKALEPHLKRRVRDDEIAALITVWQHDGTVGMGPAAESIMRETFAHFCREHDNRDLQRCARRRVARQWLDAARTFAARSQQVEATKFVWHAVRWSPKIVSEWALKRIRRMVLPA
jgi:glycosyltransferase involved in cell wall biosynthesis